MREIKARCVGLTLDGTSGDESHVQRRPESGEGHRPEDCARTLLDLIRLAPPQLNGRAFFAGDDLEGLIGDAEQIRAQDLLTLRFRAYAR